MFTCSQLLVMLRCPRARAHHTFRIMDKRCLFTGKGTLQGWDVETASRQKLTRRELQQRGATVSEDDAVNLGLHQSLTVKTLCHSHVMNVNVFVWCIFSYFAQSMFSLHCGGHTLVTSISHMNEHDACKTVATHIRQTFFDIHTASGGASIIST
jgi:hypothetical protein